MSLNINTVIEIHAFSIILKRQNLQDLKEVLLKKKVKARSRWVLFGFEFSLKKVHKWTFWDEQIWYLILIILTHRLMFKWKTMLRNCSAVVISTRKIREEITCLCALARKSLLPIIGWFKARLKLICHLVMVLYWK